MTIDDNEEYAHIKYLSSLSGENGSLKDLENQRHKLQEEISKMVVKRDLLDDLIRNIKTARSSLIAVIKLISEGGF